MRAAATLNPAIIAPTSNLMKSHRERGKGITQRHQQQYSYHKPVIALIHWASMLLKTLERIALARVYAFRRLRVAIFPF